jgi:hypothetical protein
LTFPYVFQPFRKANRPVISAARVGVHHRWTYECGMAIASAYSAAACGALTTLCSFHGTLFQPRSALPLASRCVSQSVSQSAQLVQQHQRGRERKAGRKATSAWHRTVHKQEDDLRERT